MNEDEILAMNFMCKAWHMEYVYDTLIDWYDIKTFTDQLRDENIKWYQLDDLGNDKWNGKSQKILRQEFLRIEWNFLSRQGWKRDSPGGVYFYLQKESGFSSRCLSFSVLDIKNKWTNRETCVIRSGCQLLLFLRPKSSSQTNSDWEARGKSRKRGKSFSVCNIFSVESDRKFLANLVFALLREKVKCVT